VAPVIDASHLRPLAVGEIVDASFKILRRQAGILYPISVLVMLPVGLVQVLLLAWQGGVIDFGAFLDPNLTQPQAEEAMLDLLGPYLVLLVGTLLSGLGGLLVQGGTTWAVAEAYQGRAPARKQALWQGTRRFPGLLVTVLVTGVASTIGLILCIAPGVFLFTSWSLAIPALIIEQLRPLTALGRSYRLVIKRFWPALGVLALGYLVYYILDQIVSLVATGITFIGMFSNQSFNFFPSVLGSWLVSIVVFPFIACVVTVLYFDLRVRAEGFDLERMMDELDASGPPPGPAGPSIEDPFGLGPG
jgi:hypothetical protein